MDVGAAPLASQAATTCSEYPSIPFTLHCLAWPSVGHYKDSQK